jgi:hypothetical protein
MIVGAVIALNPVKANAEVLFFDTFEQDPIWQSAPWTFETCGSGAWSREEEEGHPYPAFQAQAHGYKSLKLMDQDDDSYANAICEFPPITDDEYMVEFYFWLPTAGVGNMDKFCIYDAKNGTDDADIAVVFHQTGPLEDGKAWWYLDIRDA